MVTALDYESRDSRLMVAKSFDPLSVGTIEDSEDEGTTYKQILSGFNDEDDEEDVPQITKSQPTQGSNRASEMSSDFTFELAGGGLTDGPGVSSHSYWDFSAAKAAVKGVGSNNKTDAAVSSGPVTIEDMIQRKRQELKEKKKRKVVNVQETQEDSDVSVEDMGEVDLDAEGNFSLKEEEESGSDVEEASDVAGDDDELDEDLIVEERDAEGGDDELSGDEDQVTVAPKKEINDDEDDEDEEDQDDVKDIINEKRKSEFFAPEPEISATTEKNENGDFSNFRLSRPILKAVSDMGYHRPTPIQVRSIPLALQAHDLCVSAQTGSGKTIAFLIPIIERLLFRPKAVPATRVLILVPTRELGVQCHSVALKLCRYTDITWSLSVGGLSSKVQEAELKRRPDGIIATPGRLIDHIHNSQGFSLDAVEILVIDEADRILEDGFADELDEIIKSTPKSRQTMLFSATMTDRIEDLTKLSLTRPVRLFVNKATSLTSKLTQEFIRVRSHKEESKPALLLALCSRTYKDEVVIFFRSKAAAHYMKVVFGLFGLAAAELHGNLTQLQRLESLESFRNKKSAFLLCTDLASRGLDIPGIKTVINYDMPKSYATYIHRCGRTARAGQSGVAVSFVGESDRAVLKMAMKSSTDDIRHRVIPGKVVSRFESDVENVKEAAAEVLQEEKKEKEIRGLEMKVQKMENMAAFEDEIKGRPKKSWFQTASEKERAKELGKNKHLADMGIAKSGIAESKAPIKRGKFDGLSRHKKRLKMAREDDKKELAQQSIAARSAKKSSRPSKIPTILSPLQKAKASQASKKRSAFATESSGVRGKKKNTSKGNEGSSSSAVKPGSGVTKKKGKKVSNKAFKSLGKHKRRK